MVSNILHFIQLHPLNCVYTYLSIIQAKGLNIHDTVCHYTHTYNVISISRPK